MIEAPYEARPTLSATSAPQKKLPWIEDGAERIPDSERILDHLRRTRHDPLGEASIPPERAALHHLARRTVEESLYFVIVAERWEDADHRAAYTADLLASVPALGRPLVGTMARRLLSRQLWEQGTGRHPLDAALARGVRDLDALAGLLGDEPFFAGESPAGIDAAIWGSLANIWYTPIDGTLKRALATHSELVEWVERVTRRYRLDSTSAG